MISKQGVRQVPNGLGVVRYPVLFKIKNIKKILKNLEKLCKKYLTENDII